MGFVLIERILKCALATALAPSWTPRLRGGDGIAGDCRRQLDIVSAAGIPCKQGTKKPATRMSRAGLFEICCLLIGAEPQAFDHLPADQVIIEDRLDVFHRLVAIPGTFGIDHHHRAQFAAIKAACGIYPGLWQAKFLGAHLHVIAKPGGTLGLAATTFMASGAFVLAHEDMCLVVVFTHDIGSA